MYHGKLTYGGNWDSYQTVKFWDALDYLGVLAYFPISQAANPSMDDLADGWKRMGRELAAYSRKNGGKQVLFVEVGYNESAKAAKQPWSFETGGEGAFEIQQRCVAAALSLGANPPPWLAGMYFWKWFPEIPGREEKENFRLQTPEVKALIKKYWAAAER